MGLWRLTNSNRIGRRYRVDKDKVFNENIEDRFDALEELIRSNQEILEEQIAELMEKLDNFSLPGSDYGIIDT